jgi:peptidyl-prolyl cis-trans isomerase SurA
MRRFYPIICAGFLGCAAAFADQLVTDGIRVIVNDAIITELDVQTLAASPRDLLLRQYRNQPDVFQQRMSQVYEDAVDQLVERQLILAEFKSAGFQFPESIIEDAVEDRIKQRYHDRAELMQSLKAQGITLESFRQQRREEIIIEAMRSKNLQRDIMISPQKIVNYYDQHKTNYAVGDQVKLRMISLNKGAGDGASVKQLAAEIARKLDEGASFREMAKIYSEGAQRASEGDWGWADRTMLRKELADAAFELKPGQRSSVIDLNDSCWLILVEDKRQAHIKPLNEVQEEIERALRQTESERLRKKWVTRLKEKAFVRYF